MYLAEFLKRSTPLKALDLGYNRLEDDGAKCLAEALMISNKNLESLSLKYNNIGTEGLCALADSLSSNLTLNGVYIWGNTFEEPTCILFRNLLADGRLKQSHTDVKPYEVDGKVYLCELTHGINMYYYWQPTYGIDALNDPMDSLN